MTVSPDYTPYIDLALHDKSPADIYNAGLATLQSRVTDWQPEPTNIEVMLMEALAVEIGETLFTLNRLPKNMLYVLLSLFGVERDPGTTPTVTVTFTMQDDAGYIIPAGTEVAIALNVSDYASSDEYMSFYTNVDLTIPALSTSGTVAATATVYTNVANGMAIGTAVEVVDSLVGVQSAVTASLVADGALPETDEHLLQRGVQRLSRLVDTLVIPAHFVQAALENSLVIRANAIDNWAGGIGTPGTEAGDITVVVYGDDAPLSSGEKSALQADLEVRAAANLNIFVIDPTVTEVDVNVSVAVLGTYNEAGVLSAVATRLDEYLSPNTWPWTGTVRVNELISVIDQVPGVDFVDTMTTPTSDVVIADGATLVRAGTITVSARGKAAVTRTFTGSLTVAGNVNGA